MRSPPSSLTTRRLAEVLADGWELDAAALEYVPEGGGSYHWALTDGGGPDRRYFITVDDLGHKEWISTDRDTACGGLRSALTTAARLRDQAGLPFVVAPVAARDGQPFRRIDAQYTASVFPFLAGTSHPFGPYADAWLRDRVIDMVAELHQATPAVLATAPRHHLGFGGRDELERFLHAPQQPWSGGIYAGDARDLLLPYAADVLQLIAAFDREAAATRQDRVARPVITHGEPHPANVMSAGGRLVLIDWDTAGLAPPERDLSLVATASNDGLERYQQATGRELSPAIIGLYRLRWYLDDLGSAVRLFSNRHDDTADTTRWRDGLARSLHELPYWLGCF